jgi:hypothetical protein
LTGGLESDILGRVEKINHTFPQVIQTPGQPGMNRRDEIQADSEQYQYCQAKQDF